MITLIRSSIRRVITSRWCKRYTSSVIPDYNIEDTEVKNEPILTYEKGSKERQELEESLDCMMSICHEIPIVINDEEIKTKDVQYQVLPHNHSHKLAKYYYADENTIQKAIDVARRRQREWDKTPLEERICIWEKGADLMAGKYRQELNAATMLGQSKTVVQAEIDSAAELIDFIRMNPYFLREIAKYKPISVNMEVTKNSMRFRGIDGFIASISPFNFTAIGGNLTYTPALMGNAVLWKPSDTAMLASWTTFKVMREAGVPPGVVNFVPACGPTFGDMITGSPYLAGINFTGSVPTFNRLWRQVGENIEKYNNFPRLIGECGGKNYHLIHPSANIEAVVAGTIRAAYEYCGQKCSACSRMYVPESLWDTIRECLCEKVKELKIGDVRDFSVFTGAVIDDKAYKRITKHIKRAKSNKNLKIIAGGNFSDEVGYFIEPTIVVTKDPCDKIMREEIFGPVLAIYVFEDDRIKDIMKLIDTSTKFALTGSIYAEDESFLHEAVEALKMTAGNFYINDKSTGSVVGQQPFGGGRLSGTNDKAGGPHYVIRFASFQAVKETFVPLTDIYYPYMEQ